MPAPPFLLIWLGILLWEAPRIIAGFGNWLTNPLSQEFYALDILFDFLPQLAVFAGLVLVCAPTLRAHLVKRRYGLQQGTPRGPSAPD
jgi:hypothetical protein